MKRIPTFIAGMLTTALIGGLGVGALAATGQLTITVDPVNIQVNGETFQPKDASGNDVPVFAYNGTTYAPLRALAEAYGLDVGYDAGTNMATVSATEEPVETTPTPETAPAPDTTASTDYSDWSEEEEAAYQEFKGLWEIDTTDNTRTYVNAVCDRKDDLISLINNYNETIIQRCAIRFANDIVTPDVGMFFYYYDETLLWVDIYATNMASHYSKSIVLERIS